MALVGELAAVAPVTASLHDTVSDAAVLMRDRKVGDVIVVDDEGRIAGMLTDRDVTVRVVAERRNPEATGVGVVCTLDPVTVDSLAGVEEAEQLMREHILHRLPIVDSDRRPVGILSLEDLAVSGYIKDDELRDVLKTIARAYLGRSVGRP